MGARRRAPRGGDRQSEPSPPVLPGVWEEAGGGCSSKGLASRPGSRGDESVGELGRERRCGNLTSAHQLTRKKKERKRQWGEAKKGEQLLSCPREHGVTTRVGGHLLSSSQRSSSSRHGPGLEHGAGSAHKEQRPRLPVPRCPCTGGRAEGQSGGRPRPRRREQFGWQLDGVAGVRATSSALCRARRGWRLQRPKPPRAGWAPPASLIGNPPFGIAPSGCLCTGRSRPRCG